MSTILQIRNLAKTYANGVQAVKGIDLDVKAGDFFGLLGPNGAGKSTTIGLLTSLVNKTGGQIKIGDFDLDVDPAKAKSLLGVMPQEVNLSVFDSVMQVLLNQASYYGVPRAVAKERATKLLAELQLSEKRNTPIKLLSGGMKRRVMIARALIHEPKILLLDEPTAGVDVELRQGLWKLLQDLNRKGMTIILTTHYLEEAEMLCRNLAIINKGQVIKQGKMADLLQDLHSEILVFDLTEPLKEAPKLSFSANVRDANVLDVEVKKGECLNQLFRELLDAGVKIRSMRNDQNRLERLFIHLTQGDAA